jgi:L-lactate dehydrogenase
MAMAGIRKCAIVGAGFVGATSAFALMEAGLFSEIVLIDINAKKAEGEAMDLNHGMPFAHPVRIWAGTYDDTADAGLVIIAAGANQKPGETRIDLAGKNVEVFRTVIGEIVKRNRDCMLLVVTNPVDVLTYAALKFSGFEPSRVMGSGTVLDTARLKYLLGGHFGVDSRNIHAYIIGEHGDTELAAWSSASVAGMLVHQFCLRCGKCSDQQNLGRIFEDVKNSAYRIIEGKGATYYAVALAVRRIAQAIVRDERSVLTVSSLVSGQYGLDDVCIGLPVVVGADGVSRLPDMELSPEEMKKLHESANALKKIASSIRF